VTIFFLLWIKLPGWGGFMVGLFTNVRDMVIMTHNVRDMCRSFFLE